MSALQVTAADHLVCWMASEIEDGDVVATGVASPLALIAIALARATHAPRLTYLACVGSLNPSLQRLHRSSEDLAYLDGRSAEVSIPELFDHARRGRVDVIFFGAAEVDAVGQTNLSGLGPLGRPTVKFPGVAGACSLRRWARRPVLVVPRQSRRNLVAEVQVASTKDPARPARLLTDLGRFRLDPAGATLEAVRAGTRLEEVQAATGFAFATASLTELPIPSPEALEVIRAFDPDGLRLSLAGDPLFPASRKELTS